MVTLKWDGSTQLWIGERSVKPKTWNYKKDMPREHRPFARRVEFLFAVAWIVKRSDAGVLADDDKFYPIQDAAFPLLWWNKQ